jgi:hypothetical protein
MGTAIVFPLSVTHIKPDMHERGGTGLSAAQGLWPALLCRASYSDLLSAVSEVAPRYLRAISVLPGGGKAEGSCRVYRWRRAAVVW